MYSTRSFRPRQCWYSRVTWTLLLLRVVQGHATESHDRDLIVNGVAVDPAFPWFVFSKFGKARGCGGTLIHKDIVLSAAHCYVVFFERGAYVGGSSDYGLDGTFHEDEAITVHPSYNEDTYTDDLMLIKLETVSEATPVTLNFDPAVPAVGEQVMILGFGDVRENGPLSPELLQATLTVSGPVACREYYQPFETPISYSQLCAMDQDTTATNATRQDACQSDSGGPLLLPTTTTTTGWEQVGIISFSKGCGRENVPGVYVKLSVYQEWIEAGICALSADPPERCAANSSAGGGGGGVPFDDGQPSIISSPGSNSASQPSSSSSSYPPGGSDEGAPTMAPELWLTIFPADPGLAQSSAAPGSNTKVAWRIILTGMSLLSGFLLS